MNDFPLAPLRLTAAQAGFRAREQLGDLTGLKAHTIAAIHPVPEGWRIAVDVVERSAVPDAQDLMATFEVHLSPDGELQSYSRKRRFLRKDIHIGEES